MRPGIPAKIPAMRLAPRLLPVLVALVAWLPSVWLGGWALDDRELIEGNAVIEGDAPWTAAFERGYFEHRGPSEQWRPLATLSMRASRALWSDWTPGWHLDNVLLHALVVALAGAVLARVSASRAWVFGLCVFAAHPALADVVAWVSGRTSSLGACAGLAGALAVVRARAPWQVALASAVSVGGALLAKEDGVLFAPLCAALAWRAGRAQALASFGGGAIAWLAVGAARAAALGDFLPSAASPALGDASLAQRLAVGGLEWVEALRLTLLPFDHPPRYTAALLRARVAPVAPAVAATVGWGMAVLVPALAWRARRRLGAVAAASCAFAALALLPVVQLVPLGEVFAPRFLYLPLLFAAPFVGALHALLPRRARAVVLVAVPCALAPLAWSRATVYAGRGAWHAEVLRHDPDDARSWNDLGLAREEAGDRRGARDAFERAAALRPGYSRAWNNLGRLALEDGDDDAALAHFERASAAGPRNAAAHANLGALLLRREAWADAADAYRRAVDAAPAMAAAWRGLARALHGAGDDPAARDALDRALELAPGDPLSREWDARIP